MQLNPLVPFEPISTEVFPTEKNWIAQVKWDGVRVLTYYDGHDVKLFNRRKNERTLHYPELTNIKSFCSATSVILDGEIISLGTNGKPSFSEIMRRDSIRRMDRVSIMQKNVPIVYMIFDIIFYNGEWIHDQSLENRLWLLSDIIKPGHSVQIVPSTHDLEALFKGIKHQDMEGILIKDLNSKYYIDGKNDRWQKMKNYKDVIAVLGGVTYRNGTVNSVLLGLYDENNQFRYIGHAGTGKVTQSGWKNLTELVQPLITSERPFVNKPSRINGAFWLHPKITAKVQFAEWTAGHTLRQPSIQAFVDIPANECTFKS